ncbi:DoxX family protein [Streptomyces sp. GC420]|nr:DoxX family protein [Streptomyces sp. GC420]
MTGWADRVPVPLVRLTGTPGILGAACLRLPPLTGRSSWLAVATATGLVLIQAGGIAVRVFRGAARQIGLTIALLVAAAAAAWPGTSRL